jgi:hypothetical protein
LRRAAAALVVALACAPAIRAPPSAPPPAPPGAPEEGATPPGAGAESTSWLLADARASFDRRPDAGAVREAERSFLAAADADEGGVDGLYGAIQSQIWLIEHERDGKARSALAGKAVETGQRCLQRAPSSPICDYGFALALGVQAREHHASALDALRLMVGRLRRAAAADPKLDEAGPHRVLALVLARAPAWPIGPGDAEAAVEEARKAVALFPAHPPNQLALAEALAASGQVEEGRAAARLGVTLARERAGAGDPDAAAWVDEGERLLARLERGAQANRPPG